VPPRANIYTQMQEKKLANLANRCIVRTIATANSNCNKRNKLLTS
jgi:hypothetical protein